MRWPCTAVCNSSLPDLRSMKLRSPSTNQFVPVLFHARGAMNRRPRRLRTRDRTVNYFTTTSSSTDCRQMLPSRRRRHRHCRNGRRVIDCNLVPFGRNGQNKHARSVLGPHGGHAPSVTIINLYAIRHSVRRPNRMLSDAALCGPTPHHTVVRIPPRSPRRAHWRNLSDFRRHQ